MKKSTLAFAALLLAGAMSLTACSGGTSPATSPAPEPTEESVNAPELGVAWLNGGTAIALETFGSGTRGCWPLISDVTADGNTVTVEVAPPEDTICTMDYRAQHTYVELPEGVDSSSDVTVVVRFLSQDGAEFTAGVLPGSTDLGPTDQAPSAGWLNRTTLALVTFGSSSADCWPTPTDAATDGANGELLVQFAEPTAAMACTSDLVPQLQAIYVPESVGAEDRSTITELVLNGAGYQNQSVVIAPAKF